MGLVLAPFDSASKGGSPAMPEAEGAGGASASPYWGLVFLPVLQVCVRVQVCVQRHVCRCVCVHANVSSKVRVCACRCVEALSPEMCFHLDSEDHACIYLEEFPLVAGISGNKS